MCLGYIVVRWGWVMSWAIELLDMDEVVIQVEEQEEVMMKSEKVVHWWRIEYSCRNTELDFAKSHVTNRDPCSFSPAISERSLCGA